MLDIDATYPGQTAGTNANYPSGEARNVTVSGDGLGTPWEAQLLNDFLGFREKVIADAGVSISGSPDTAIASDVLDALEVLLLSRSELVTEGGNILVTGNRLPRDHRDGLLVTQDSTVLMTAAPGSVRDQANASDIVLPTSLQKAINATWVDSAGGGLPDGLTVAPNTWYRRFLASKPDGSPTWFWDTSPTAANFFADANAIAAGFSDSSLFRRWGWTRTNGSSQIKPHHNDPADPTRFTWDQIDPSATGISTISSVSRTTFDLAPGVPPDTYGILAMFLRWATDAVAQVLITTEDQDDIAATNVAFTLRTTTTRRVGTRGRWLVNATSQLFGRRDGGTAVDTLDIISDGWIDPAIN